MRGGCNVLSLPHSQVVKLNYYALAVSILGECIPETAFEKIQSDKPQFVKNQLTDDDWDDMAKLRAEGIFYKDLGAIYCMDPATIHRKLKRLGLKRFE